MTDSMAWKQTARGLSCWKEFPLLAEERIFLAECLGSLL